MKSIVIFGAGKIGRSFIGQIFSKGGYQVIFADVDRFLVNELNYHKEYEVIIKGETEKYIPVYNIRAIHLANEDVLLDSLDNTNIAAVSVGQNGLPDVIKILARSIVRRQEQRPGSPIDLIIAENMRDSDIFIRQELKKLLPPDFPLDKSIGLIETSIGKMVPDNSNGLVNHSPLSVFAEEYNTLILSKNGFLNPIPAIPELSPKENIKAWVDRKLFIHNFGHAALAYLTAIYKPNYIYTWEALADKNLLNEVYLTMKESAFILSTIYPEEFNNESLESHIIDLLKRFANKSLGDTIYRVGCDLKRKLGPDDRIVPLIRMAGAKKLPYLRILKVLIAGIYFPAVNEKGKMIEADRLFKNRFNNNVEKVLKDHCGFDTVLDKLIYKDAAKISPEIKY